MANKVNKHIDGSRKRCLECGHPRREHRQSAECTVPKCACERYSPLLALEQKQHSTPS
jgi:hypothetical protein